MTTDFQDIFIGLLKNMCSASVFFISDNIHNYIDVNDIEKVDPNFLKLINKPQLIDHKGFHIEEPKRKYAVEVMNKKGLLLNNMFKLSQCKDTYGNEGFKYLLEKYGTYIESFFFIAQWLNDNYVKHVDIIDDDLKRAFNFQFLYFKEHKTEFELRFQINTKPILSPNDVLSNTIKDNDFVLPTLNYINKGKATKTDSKKIKANSKKDYIEKLKKDTLENAENYLLESVFNVKL